jgi:hypothetical protein
MMRNGEEPGSFSHDAKNQQTQVNVNLHLSEKYTLTVCLYHFDEIVEVVLSQSDATATVIVENKKSRIRIRVKNWNRSR